MYTQYGGEENPGKMLLKKYPRDSGVEGRLFHSERKSMEYSSCLCSTKSYLVAPK
jgi:hypothetical protein